ncbi:mucin-5AC-like [Chrysoperla carnea]|uniref:mucin-5AC-like n=1 Tax=Chrysoperla carnea TaxID=189513 RepID=UPI001D08A0C4|nr:mucin-5AC-like [Chrysoperla carnea]
MAATNTMSNTNNNVLVKTQRDTRIKLRDVNDHLTCFICKGYYIDATTIVECLHSFCRSCIIKRLQFKSYCPVCEMMINKAKPNIKPDKTLQDIVYKLVPGLHRDEMRRRRQFYNNLNENKSSAAAIQTLNDITPEQRGEDNERVIYNATDPISLSLEYCSTECDLFMTNNNNLITKPNNTNITKLKTITSDYDDDCNKETNNNINNTTPATIKNGKVINNGITTTIDNNNHCHNDHNNIDAVKTKKDVKNDDNNETTMVLNGNIIPQTRYLQCPAGVSVRLLKKFLIGKFDINIHQYHIDILYKRVPLPDEYKLMDIAYIYSWKRNEPMRIFYRVMDIKYAMNRFDFFNPSSICAEPIKKPTKIDTTSPIRDIKTSPTSPKTSSSATITVKSEPNMINENNIKCEKSISDTVQVKIENIDENCDNNNENLMTTTKNIKIKKEICDETTVTTPPLSPVTKKNVNCDSEKSKENVLKEKPEEVENQNKKVKNNENKLKLCENKQQNQQPKITSSPLSSILNANNATSSTSPTQPPKIVIDEENEREKSIFLNTFQLTSTKSLSPNQLNKKSLSPSSITIPHILPASTTKHKTSPKKVSPKSSSTPATKPTPKQKQQQQTLLPVPNGFKPTTTSTPGGPQPEVRTKRKYTFKTRPMGKKARLELERQQALIAATQGPSKNTNLNITTKPSPTANKNVVNKVINGFKSALTTSSTTPGASSPRVGDKRKIVSFNLPASSSNSGNQHPVPEKRANYNNTNTSKLSETNSLKSLFDNCNLNIPSSLSITLTEGPNDREIASQQMITSPIELNNTSPMMNSGSRSPASSTSSNASSNGTNNSQPANFGGKRQSPPVNMYIEIFKIPDKVEPTHQTPPVPSNPSTQEQKQSKIPATISRKVPNMSKEKGSPPASLSTTTTSTTPSTKTPPTPTTPSTASSNTSASSANNSAAAKQQNIHKVTSLSTTNFVVHTTGIQSLGRKDAAASKTSSTLPTPNGGQQLGRKILPKLTPNSSTNGSFIPKLAESSKSATGFQKMFEEAIKRKEQAKAAQSLTKATTGSPSTTPSTGSQQTINRKKELNKSSTSTTVTGNGPEEKVQSNIVLDLSSPNNRSKPNMVPKTSPMVSGNKSPLSSPLSIQTNSHPPPRLTMPKNNKKITTNPQSNLISSTESGSSNSPKGRCGTPLPALSVSVVPSNNNTSPAPPPTTALSPTTIQQQFNLTNLAQLQQVMLLRQIGLRNQLLQQKQHQTNMNSTSSPSGGSGSSPSSSSSIPNGETLMQFENYMKSLQQQAALASAAAAAAAAQQSVTQNKK